MMNYNPQALGKEFRLTPYYACILHLANIQQSLEKKKTKVEQISCVSYSFPARWEIQRDSSKLSFKQGWVCVLFGPIPSWLVQIFPSTQPLRGCLFISDEFFFLHLNFTWFLCAVSRPRGSLFPARLALCWAVEMSRSSLFLSQTFPW